MAYGLCVRQRVQGSQGQAYHPEASAARHSRGRRTRYTRARHDRRWRCVPSPTFSILSSLLTMDVTSCHTCHLKKKTYQVYFRSSTRASRSNRKARNQTDNPCYKHTHPSKHPYRYIYTYIYILLPTKHPSRQISRKDTPLFFPISVVSYHT